MEVAQHMHVLTQVEAAGEVLPTDEEFEVIKNSPNQNRLLDLQLEAAIRGDMDTCDRISRIMSIRYPNNPAGRFNSGYSALRNGYISDGFHRMQAGRAISSYGSDLRSNQPMWDGHRNCTVLFIDEGGLGDEIHFIRYTKILSEKYNCKVVVAGSFHLAGTFLELPWVDFFVLHDAIPFVYHDVHFPAMAAPYLLGLEVPDVSGEAYIPRTHKKRGKGKIGVRWAGSEAFDHNDIRQFPPEKLFSALEGYRCVSLQKDSLDKYPCPEWMEQPPLDTWEDTRRAICDCDIVISSCTSVAHMSAAMGIETWIIIPALAYFLWADGKDTSIYYDSVRLFRQKEYPSWDGPFTELTEELDKLGSIYRWQNM